MFSTIPNWCQSYKPGKRIYSFWSHHSAKLDDSCGILSKRNSLCGKINNVLCDFRNRNPVVKLKLSRFHCSDFYGSMLWDLAHPSVEDVCITWRKGLKRVGELPTRTRCGLVSPVCGLLLLRFELTYRCSRFDVKCLNSSNSIVRFVAGHYLLHQRMHSHIGRDAQHFATLLGTPLSKPASNNKKMPLTTVTNRVLSGSDFSNMDVIRELFIH